MNKKFLLAALAIPMAFTACTDDFGANETVIKETYVDGDKIHLGDDFVLTGTRADVEGESRSAWVTGNGTRFYWIPKDELNQSLTTYNSSTDWALYTKDAIGLCYVNNAEILTNYKFDHDGWVAVDELGQYKNDVWKCVEGIRYYDRNYLRFDGLQYQDVTIDNIENNKTLDAVHGILSKEVSSQKLKADKSGLESLDKENKYDELNLSRAIFKTEEKTIFKGEYIAYYPWSNAMLEAGNVTAVSPVKMVYESGDYTDRVNALNKYMFACGWVGTIEGGVEVAEMKLQNISKLMTLKLDLDNSTEYYKLLLLDPSSEEGNFINKMELTTDQVKASNYSGTTIQTSQTVMIDFNTSIEDWSGSYYNDYATVYVPTFKTEIPAGMLVLAVKKDGTAVYYKTTETFAHGSGLATQVTDYVLDMDSYQYDVVTNEAELLAANASASKKSILLVGKIELNDNGVVLKKNLVGHINGVKVGELVLPASDEEYSITAQEISFDCNVTVEAAGCCHNYGGNFILNGITLKENQVFENQNTVTFSQNYTNKIYGTFDNKPFVEEDVDNLIYAPATPKTTVEALGVVYVYGKMNNIADTYRPNTTDEKVVLAEIVIESDPTTDDTRKDGEISVISNGKLVNNAYIENYGTMSNQTGKRANIENNEGATYVLKIGGQLTGALLKNAENRRCDFIAEVDNAKDSRWTNAWEQKLANIIKIVKETNANYVGDAEANIYPFLYTMNGQATKTVNNKNVQIVVENPAVTFVGDIKSPSSSVVNATIGRLLINHDGTTGVNTTSSYRKLQLTIDNTTWAGNECAAGEAVNAIDVKAGEFLNDKYSFEKGSKASSIQLNVVGAIEVSGTYTEKSNLKQSGNITAEKGGNINFVADSYFDITGEMVSLSDKGILFGERVLGFLHSGNITVKQNAYMEVAGDGVITVDNLVVNNGKMKWISRTGTKSPGIVWCAGFSANNPANWVNGTPIIGPNN